MFYQIFRQNYRTDLLKNFRIKYLKIYQLLKISKFDLFKSKN